MNPNFAYGTHTILSLLQNHPERILELYLVSNTLDEKKQAIIQYANKAGIAIQYVQKKKLDSLLHNAVHQGIAAKVKPKKKASEEEIVTLLKEKLAQSLPCLVLVLDTVQDPHNLGAALRTALAAQVDAVIIPRDKAAGLTPLVEKIASGAADKVPLIEVTNLVRFLEQLKSLGLWIVGTSLTAPKSIYKTDLTLPLVLVVGSEDKGLRRLTEETCDFLVKIPLLGEMQSLNVSVSVGICLFEILRQQGRV